MPIQVILTQNVQNLGKAGEVVSVKNGYGRNFLIPKGLAVVADQRNKTRIEHERVAIERRMAQQRSDAEGIANRLSGMTLQFERLVGEDDRMFGSVTTRDIQKQLEVAGLELDHRKIELGEPVKALGKYEAPVHLGADVVATLKFWVVGKERE
jgi:large subunit ribosomal protein L9